MMIIDMKLSAEIISEIG